MIAEAIAPLRMIFWGGLLCLIDIYIVQASNGLGFRIDILKDAVGAVMIAIGVFRLSSLAVQPSYDKTMTFVKVVAVLAILDALRDHFVTPLPLAVALILYFFDIVKPAAVIAFCVAMRLLCKAKGLKLSEASWRITTNLFVLFYAIPHGIMQALGMAAIASGSAYKVSIDIGPLGLLWLPLSAIPINYFFVSTSRMQREEELRAAGV